jgi:predicted secreted hydrolase
LPLIDHLKCHHGDSDMSDERLQEICDDWFLKASPLERQQTLISVKAELDQVSDSTTLRQRVPLVQLNRRLSAIEANLKRLGR